MKPETQFVMDWITRMNRRYGSAWVHDTTQDHKAMDWGQALCREQYGPNWENHPDFGDDPSPADVERAKAWEAGDWPEWVDTDDFDLSLTRSTEGEGA